MPDRSDCYAVHWVPPPTDRLARFGLGWTGWCAETGSRHHRLRDPVEGIDLAPITREPARQGFHALVRAPFRLDQPRRVWALERALFDAAEACSEFVLPRLVVGVTGGRVALVPEVEDHALTRLLRRIDSATAAFAPGAPADSPPCTVAEGVPVRPAPSFHMPLTDPLPLPAACRLAQRLAPALAPLLGGGHLVSELALVVDPGAGHPVRVVQRLGLGEAVAPGPEPMACRGPRLLAPFPGTAVGVAGGTA